MQCGTGYGVCEHHTSQRLVKQVNADLKIKLEDRRIGLHGLVCATPTPDTRLPTFERGRSRTAAPRKEAVELANRADHGLTRRGQPAECQATPGCVVTLRNADGARPSSALNTRQK